MLVKQIYDAEGGGPRAHLRSMLLDLEQQRLRDMDDNGVDVQLTIVTIVLPVQLAARRVTAPSVVVNTAPAESARQARRAASDRRNSMNARLPASCLEPLNAVAP